MKKTVVELVMYKVRPESVENHALLIDQVNDAVSKFPGFQSREVHQHPEDPHLFVDYVKWDSLEQAQEAAAHMPKIEALSPFMAAIEEVKSMQHFTLLQA